MQIASRLRWPTLLLATVIAALVFTWPLERRHLQLTEYSFVTEAYTEATTLAFYASDLVFMVLFVAWWLQTRSTKTDPKKEGFSQLSSALWFLAAFLGWAILTTFLALWKSPNSELTKISFYVISRTGFGAILFLMVSDVSRVRFLRNVLLWSIVSAGTFQAILSIYQVSLQRDAGLFLLGEQELSLEKPGVAKVDLHAPDVSTETKFLRAYGTTQHPNVLGGILVAALASLLILLPENGSIKQKILILDAVLLIMGVLLTFSRTAWISAGGVLLFFGFYRNLGRKVLVSALIGTLLPLLLIPNARRAAYSRIVPPETDQYVQLRETSYEAFLKTFQKHPLLGVGMGRGFLETYGFLENKNDNLSIVKEPWEYQYVHSAPLLIALETGSGGLLLFLGFLLSALRPLQTLLRTFISRSLFHGILMTTLLLGASAPFFFDHYLWTTQQGRMLLWGVLGVFAAYGAPVPLASPSRPDAS